VKNYQEITGATQDCSDEMLSNTRMSRIKNIIKNIYAARRLVLLPLSKNIGDVMMP
jgi:hypothetical protein